MDRREAGSVRGIEVVGMGQSGMIQLGTIRWFLRYNDWANDHVLLAAGQVGDAKLDQPFDMGPGSLRRTLLHMLVAEDVFLKRGQGQSETPWGNEDERILVAQMKERFDDIRRRRDAFLATLGDGDLPRAIVYRDSFGSLYSTTLGDMLFQVCLHSMHHRAQVVNMMRRLGAKPPELDYMYWVRRPAKDAG